MSKLDSTTGNGENESTGTTTATSSGQSKINELYDSMIDKRADMIEGTLDGKVAKDVMNTVS